MLTRIRANTDLVIAQLGPQSGIPGFGRNRESLAFVEQFIERTRSCGLGSVARENMAAVFGCFLGECVIAAYGGEWEEYEGTWCVRFANGTMAFPFAKVCKLVENGLEGGDSIVSFYRVVPFILTR
ncbi:hypothetical protein F8S13_14295 [Chloroflexia bacterium SDU3-3]|nr:hypothetical protein F8S13_14295 [Chloroflexia bacterium SDU3-3]